MDDRLYFRQLLTGRDLARADPVARQMLNFVYLIGDRETGEAVAVDPEQMWFSLTQRLSRVPDHTVLYPGHLYAPEPSATMGETRARNYVFGPKSLEEWMRLFGR